MKIFVTGASGFVGGHIAATLAAAGHEVLGLARSAHSAEKVSARGAAPVRGALGSVDPSMLEGIDAIVHAAAYVEDWGPKDAFFATNVEGTRQLLGAARGAGVRRFILIGTEASVFVGHDLVDIDEDVPLRPDSPFHYSASKAAAEQLVRGADGPGLTTAVLRPRLVWGPGDTSVLPAVLRILDDGGFWWMGGGQARTSTCHVDNIAAATARALEAPAGDIAGQAFFIADDEDTTIRAFLSALVETTGRRLPSRSLPGGLLRGASWLLDRLWRALGRTTPPPLTPFSVHMMSRTVTVKTDRARQRLGWTPVISRADGLAAMKKGADQPSARRWGEHAADLVGAASR